MKSILISSAVLVSLFSASAWADISGTTSISSGQSFSLDTGAVSTAGDFTFTGSSLTLQGGATGAAFPGGGGAATYGFLTQALVQQVAALFSSAPIPTAVDAVIAFKTRGGNFAKMLVTAQTGSSLTFQYTTFGVSSGGGPTAPTISFVTNAAGYIPQSLPGGGVAQGSMFVVFGKGMGPANIVIAPSFPLQTTLGGTSVSVTVGGRTVNAIMYYTLAGQVAAILPSSAPTGTGTFTVTYNGLASAPAPITVVANAFSTFTTNSAGSGDAIAFINSDNRLVTPNHAANPGDVIVLWGTGLGPVTGDETQPATQADLSVPVEVFIGGKPATVLFRGRNACCSSVDTIYVTVPAGVSGCLVPVITKIGNTIGNGTSIAVAASGRTCSLTTPGFGSVDINSLLGKANVSFGGVTLSRITSKTSLGTSSSDTGGATFIKFAIPPGGLGVSSTVDIATYGSCTVTFATASSSANPTANFTFLDAGASIALSGPGGPKTLAKLSLGGLLAYSASLDQTGNYLVAGGYTATGPGGPDVGPFTAQITLPQPLVWTNQASITTVNRSAGQAVTWTGGDPAGYVTISGSSSAGSGVNGATAAFTCIARTTDLSFTIPPPVLLALPPTATANTGTLAVSSFTNAVPFTASGLDFASIIGSVANSSTVSYQ